MAEVGEQAVGDIGHRLGAGFGGSFRPSGMEGVSYLEYFYPGVMLMMMLFASIFSSITIIEDRDAGFLQGVLVAPVSRLAIVLGKVLGCTSIAMVQTLIFTVAAIAAVFFEYSWAFTDATRQLAQGIAVCAALAGIVYSIRAPR